jgi:2-methylcitrate dehydratase
MKCGSERAATRTLTGRPTPRPLTAFPSIIAQRTGTQTAIVAATEVAREAGSVDRISAVEVATTRRGYLSAGSEPEKWAPENRETADHSLPYITARAIFDGDITNDSYTADKLRDPRILAFMRKITVKEDPQLTAGVGKEGVPTRITATLDDGRRIVRQVNDIPGFPGRPMQRPSIERKFRSNVLIGT